MILADSATTVLDRLLQKVKLSVSTDSRMRQGQRSIGRMRREPIACVYFLHAEGTNLVKVGWTGDLDRRVHQLQTASPHKLRLLGVHLGDKDVERVYHKDLQPYRQRGEWFFLTHEVRRWLSRCLNMHYEAMRACCRFHSDTVADDREAARDHYEWASEVESFNGERDSTPSVLYCGDVAEVIEGIDGLRESEAEDRAAELASWEACE
jgi:hypothetical protein